MAISFLLPDAIIILSRGLVLSYSHFCAQSGNRTGVSDGFRDRAQRRRFAIPRRLSAATVLNLLEQTKERLNGLVCALALIKGTN